TLGIGELDPLADLEGTAAQVGPGRGCGGRLGRTRLGRTRLGRTMGHSPGTYSTTRIASAPKTIPSGCPSWATSMTSSCERPIAISTSARDGISVKSLTQPAGAETETAEAGTVAHSSRGTVATTSARTMPVGCP